MVGMPKSMVEHCSSGSTIVSMNSSVGWVDAIRVQTCANELAASDTRHWLAASRTHRPRMPP